jgi:hypothetical protein
LQVSAEPKAGTQPRKPSFAVPDSFDDWDDFDMNVGLTKNKSKPVFPARAAADAPSTNNTNNRRKSLFDDDDDFL